MRKKVSHDYPLSGLDKWGSSPRIERVKQWSSEFQRAALKMRWNERCPFADRFCQIPGIYLRRGYYSSAYILYVSRIWVLILRCLYL